MTPDDCSAQSVSQDDCYYYSYCDDSYQEAYCGQNGDTVNCECYTESTRMSLELSNIGIGDSCAFAAELCASGETPAFDDPAVCELTWEYAGRDYCDNETRCTQSADLADGVAAKSHTYSYAGCRLISTGVWQCDCYADGANASFRIPTTADSSDVCAQGTDICHDVQSVEPSGPISCSQNFQWSSGQSCSASLECTQNAKVGDIDVGMMGSISAQCEGNDGGYDCYCSSGNDVVAVEVTSEDAPWDVCTEVVQGCPELVGIQFGQSGGYYGMPVPFGSVAIDP